MFKEIKTTKVKSDKRDRLYERITYTYVCDSCGQEFERKKLEKRQMHFHSRECYQQSMKSGVAHDYVTSQMTENVKVQIKQTMLERHGVNTAFFVGDAQKRARETCIERYGSPSSMSDPEVRRKKEQTFVERYGVRAPISQCDLIVSKSIKTQIERYGDIYPRTQVWRDDIKEWSMKNYGVEHFMQSDVFKQKFDFRAMWLKQHETKKRNGTYAASKIERQFGEFLKERFGDDQVETQILVNGWSIDFFIKSINTYVQFDGAYWHGLDRTLEEIQASENQRDQRIFESYQKDRHQNSWFMAKNIRLIRIIDREFKTTPDTIIERILHG